MTRALGTVANRITVILALVMIVQTYSRAENRLSLKRGQDNRIGVELSNTDAIAGLQFTINATGIELGSYEGTERTSSAALGIYQYLKDESTLNVIILAPVRSALSAGQGAIGTISFRAKSTSGEPSIQVFLSNVVVCDREAKSGQVIVVRLPWNAQDALDSQAPAFELEQNYPNPFNPSTNISYRLEKPAYVRLTVYDIAGRQVRVLVDQNQYEGKYIVTWNADDRSGATLGSGVYIARLCVGNQVAMKRMIFAK